MAKRAEWTEQTDDGYRLGAVKMDGVKLDGYLAEVVAPGWTYTGRFNSLSSAQQWCRHRMARDRRAPMQRPAE